MRKFPKDKDVARSTAWWAYTKLRQDKDPGALLPIDTLPEGKYATAWWAFRSSNGGERAALHDALAAWTTPDAEKDNAERATAIREEAVLFASRLGTLQDVDQRDQLRTARAMGQVGRIAEAIDATRALAPGAADPVSLRFDVMQYERRRGDPSKIAEATLAAFDACGAQCPRAQELVNEALELHETFSTSGDTRFYQAAHDLYGTLRCSGKLTDPALRKSVGDYGGNLEATKKNLKPAKGHLDKAIVERVIADHKPEVEGCYEAAIQGNPTLTGTTGTARSTSTRTAGSSRRRPVRSPRASRRAHARGAVPGAQRRRLDARDRDLPAHSST